ncbi:MAG: ribosome biogenesis GTP-binding protein YihA/YsxC [Rickettsiales bacterium]|jgi:GTP-binding protein|nr:ribosome biogenesis GTP-binding protein YihA/YsxC [Rickettsiales bacterium]
MIKFIGSFETFESLPQFSAPEFAFIGRSNVGKSSLLNALVNEKAARTSNTPGRTQSINLFEWKFPPPLAGGVARGATGGGQDDFVILADLPGYGYARASKTDITKWAVRLEKYLLGRANLRKLFILIDARHGLKDSDRDMMTFCDNNAIRYQVVLTKLDKISKTESERRKAESENEIQKRGASCPVVIATSATKKIGIDELQNECI